MLVNSDAPIGPPVTETTQDRARRRALGIYYTPPEAAIVLARWAIRNPKETVLEPSFGGCAMLSAAVNVFNALGNARPSKQLYGYDVDAAAFTHLTRMGIVNADQHFKLQDFLLSDAGNLRVHTVLANPPFVSYHRLDDKQRQLTEILRKRYLPQLPRLASLWVYFLLHAMTYLRQGGKMAFVLPNAVGTADYAQPLLAHLCSKFTHVKLVNVTERLFIQAGADERISLLLMEGYEPKGVEKPAQLCTNHVFNINEISALDSSNRDPLKGEMDVRDQAADALKKLNGEVLCELGAVATVRIGEVVGDIPFFVKPLSEWRKLKVPTKYLFPLLTRSFQIQGVYTTNSTNGDSPSTIPMLLVPPTHRVPGAITAYLSTYPKADIDSNQTFIKRPIWNRCSYSADSDAFIGSISHDYPRVIGNDARISCSNAFYKIDSVARPDIATWLPIISLTTPFRLSAEVKGRVRGSGGIKLEPSDVKSLLVPTKVPQFEKKAFKLLQSKFALMLAKGDLDAANQLADSEIFLKPKLISSELMDSLRKNRIALTGRRLPNKNGI